MIAGVQLNQILAPLVDGHIYPWTVTEIDATDHLAVNGNIDFESLAPYITYTDVSAVPENTMDGFTGHEWVRMQIDVWHDDKYEGILLANKVINAINSNIQPSVYGGKTSMYDAESKLYRQLIEYEFWQTTPTE